MSRGRFIFMNKSKILRLLYSFYITPLMIRTFVRRLHQMSTSTSGATLSHKFWTSPKSCEETAKALQESSLKHKFGVLTTFDLKAKMNEKGVPFDQDCRIIEVCNPSQAAKVLKENMNVSLALPCRISVYSDKGTTKVGFTLPSTILPQYMGDKASPELVSVADEVDQSLVAIVEDALKGIQS